LELITLRNLPIQSLTFEAFTTRKGRNDPDLSSLNVDSLNNVRMIGLNTEMSMHVLDIVQRSSSPTFTLVMENFMETQTTLLEHDLMKRVVDLRLLSGKSLTIALK
jgi:hypothetical protein